MRRLLTALMIVLVVLVVGLSALVLLINPNDFRSYMVREVEQRSGYKLALDGPLRWHVWPQLSILSGRMSLTAPGASAPLVSAENMRLDVALLPLISHRLQVEQVMLKKSVIQLTPQSEARRPEGAPVAPGEPSPVTREHRNWSFDIGSLNVADSLLVFQHADDEQITVRNIQLQLEQNNHRQALVSLNGRVNRDQRDLSLAIEAVLDANEGGDSFSAEITRLNYQLQGADLPKQGIRGEGALKARWDDLSKRLSIRNLNLTANESSLRGELSVVINDKPKWQLALTSDNLNLDTLVARVPLADTDGDDGQPAQAAVLPRPVISSSDSLPAWSLLNSSDGSATLQFARLRWRGLEFTDVNARMVNQNGKLNIERLDGGFGAGSISLPGSVDASKAAVHAVFQPQVSNIEIASILKAFDYPLAVSGSLSMKGEFSGDAIDAQAFRRNWQGKASVEMANSRLEGMNFQQLVQRAVTRNNSDVQAQRDYDDATVMEHFNTSATLDSGKLQLQQMTGESAVLALTGNGSLDLVNEQCDANFAVRVIGGWEGKGELIERLTQTPIQLRIYGPWSQLSYNLDVDRVLRNQLQDEAKRRLKEWAERNKDGSSKARDVQQLLKERESR